MDTRFFIAAGIIAVAFMIKFLWRTEGRYGEFKPNRSVAEAFEGFRVDPGLNYYLSGSDVCPNAIMGIDKAWVLESDLWRKREMSSAGLKELVQSMQSRAAETNRVLHGFDILDARGSKIGTWFSVLDLNMTMTVEITGDKRCAVPTPPQDTYQQF